MENSISTPFRSLEILTSLVSIQKYLQILTSTNYQTIFQNVSELSVEDFIACQEIELSLGDAINFIVENLRHPSKCSLEFVCKLNDIVRI